MSRDRLVRKRRRVELEVLWVLLAVGWALSVSVLGHRGRAAVCAVMGYAEVGEEVER
jgi:hypothetical protein